MDTPKPPDTRRRKADIGDTVIFVVDATGRSQYYPHTGHTAEVLAVNLLRQQHRPGPRAVYVVHCECGMTLRPRAGHFDVL